MTLAAVFPPMPTPFADGEVDAAAIRCNVERWMRAGLGGVVALGTNGEAALLDEDEADRVLERVAAMPSRASALVIAGTGRESTRATIAASRRAAALGADVGARSHALVLQVADDPAGAACRTYTRGGGCVARFPCCCTTFPRQTGVNFSPDTVAALAAHPNIAGMKETGTDAAQLAALCRRRFLDRVLGARRIGARFLSPALCVGARGAILAVACVLPELCVRLHSLTREGRHGEARALQRA